MSNWKQKTLTAIGIFLIASGALAMNYAIFRGEYSSVFWLCYIGLIGAGLGTLTQKSWLIASQLNILTIPLILWQGDFFLQWLFDYQWLGISQYFFSDELLPLAKIISLEHLFLLPLAFIALGLAGLNQKNSWKLSVVEIGIVAALLHLFANGVQNINCVFRTCLPWIANGPDYFFKWLIIVLIMIFLTNWLINRLFYRPKQG